MNPTPFLTPRPRPKHIDHQVEQAAADDRDTAALTKFFSVILNDALRPSCSRLGSSQNAARRRKHQQR